MTVFSYKVSDKLKAVLKAYGLSDSTVEIASLMVEIEVAAAYKTYLAEMIAERTSNEPKRS